MRYALGVKVSRISTTKDRGDGVLQAHAFALEVTSRLETLVMLQDQKSRRVRTQ